MLVTPLLTVVLPGLPAPGTVNGGTSSSVGTALGSPQRPGVEIPPVRTTGTTGPFGGLSAASNMLLGSANGEPATVTLLASCCAPDVPGTIVPASRLRCWITSTPTPAFLMGVGGEVL